MNPFAEYLRMSLDELRGNRVRTLLTLLGIVIGVAAVVVVGSVARSGRASIFKELETFGLRSMWVYKARISSQPGKSAKHGSGVNLEDIEAIAREVPGVARLSPVVHRWRWAARYENRHSTVNVVAVNADFDEINNDRLDVGRYLLAQDVERRRPVCVIGQRVAEELFLNGSPVGREVRVGDFRCTVVGVLARKDRDFLSSIGSAGGRDANLRVIIPITLYLKQYNTREVDYLQAEAGPVLPAVEVAEEIKRVLLRRHRGDYRYESQTMEQYAATANNILKIVSWIGGLAAAVSLVVGGIGIMNIMTASVVERTREIGLRKAVGARKLDISLQFLTEATLISVFGAALGAFLGVVSVQLLAAVTGKPVTFAFEYLGLALLVSLVVGIVSGMYPAARAAAMDPVEALKYE